MGILQLWTTCSLASGIGRAIANIYLEHGARVFLVDLPGSKLTEQFRDTDNAACLEKDITDSDAPKTIVDGCVSAFGELHILVNNAGIAIGGEFEDLTDEQMRHIFEVNVNSIFRISQAAVPHLKKQDRARIINLGSIMSALSEPFMDDPEFKAYWENKAPIGRLGDPEEVAYCALFLAADAGQFISGLGLNVDGGAMINF